MAIKHIKDAKRTMATNKHIKAAKHIIKLVIKQKAITRLNERRSIIFERVGSQHTVQLFTGGHTRL